MFMTKDLSISSSSSGSRLNCVNDDPPVPKSSSEMPKPISRVQRSTANDDATACMIALSVTSRIRSFGSRPFALACRT
jgi:hypothetical protein